MDNTAKTLTVGNLVIQVTSETKIMSKDKPATLQDAVVGEPVSGRYTKNEEGKLTALSIHLGAKEGKNEVKKEETGAENNPGCISRAAGWKRPAAFPWIGTIRTGKPSRGRRSHL